jgi:Eco57I restriction-modification methylase/TaqI-like C-terminal specificity domain
MANHQPLIHPRVWDKHLKALGSNLAIPPEHAAVLQHWAQTIRDKSIYAHTESNLRGAFIDTLFIKVLGYAQFGSGVDCTIITEKQAGSGAADVALGVFTTDQSAVTAPVELKGPDTRNLDAVMPGRHKSPVTQVWEYANDIAGASVMVVSNMLELRVYVLGRGKQAFERFDLQDVASDARQYQRLQLLLGAQNLLSGAAQRLLDETRVTEREITEALYADYKRLRVQTIIALVQANTSAASQPSAPAHYIPLAQKILDRVLFVAFCEDRGLLPEKLLESVIKFRNPFAPTPHWDSFKALFRFIDVGHAGDPAISAYNGGLFAPDAVLDALKLPDDMCEQLAALGKYDFDTDIPVTVLGHIFEQSIEDLERLQALADAGNFTLDALQAQVSSKTTSVSGARKTHGIVYTPDFITRFIVDQTIGQLLAERQANTRERFEAITGTQAAWRKPSKQEIKDYKRLARDENRITEYLFWQAWHTELRSLKICDPACGSGAFLIAAFEALEPAYNEINEAVQSITGTFDLFDTDKDILTGNLYGVDLNAESIEISMLSLWLKTAKRGKKLENLAGTLKVGNSIIGTDAELSVDAKGFDWQNAFPEVMAQGGFDAVIGNPPYVRQETISKFKPYLQKNYAVYDGVADLYVYFFEQGVRLLKQGGRMGYVSSSTFFKAGFGQNLRGWLTANTELQTLVDFGDLQVFEGVTTYPAIVITKKAVLVAPTAVGEMSATADKGVVSDPMPVVKFLQLTNELPKDLSKHFAATAQTMPQAQLGSGSQAWRLESQASSTLRDKLTQGRKTLKEVYGSPLYGVKTGLNEAFVLTRQERDELVKAQPKSEAFFKPFLRGEDLKKWRTESQGLWLLLFKRGITRELMQRKDVVPESEAWRWLQAEYAPIAAWLKPFEVAAKKRTDKGEYWWELRACSYYEAFDAPKLIYTRFMDTPVFALESAGGYMNNALNFVAGAGYAELALLNSKVSWFNLKSSGSTMSGGFLQIHGHVLEKIAIPEMDSSQKQELARLAQQAQSAAEARRDVIKKFGRMVLRDFAGSNSKNPSAKLPSAMQQAVPNFTEFTAVLKDRFKRELTLSEKNDWEAALDKARDEVLLHTNTIAACEQAIDKLVYELFELTADEVALVEG